jgi:putative transposase
LLIQWIKNGGKQVAQYLQKTFLQWTAPTSSSSPGGAVLDITSTKAQLLAENALLRQQLIVLQRQVKHPHLKPLDRFVMVILANWLHSWRQTLLIVKPDTLIRRHKQGFKLFWKFKSKPKSKEPKPKIAEETIILIKQMAAENKLWELKESRESLGRPATQGSYAKWGGAKVSYSRQ